MSETTTPTTTTAPTRRRSYRSKISIGNPPATGLDFLDDVVHAVEELRAAVVPLRATADEALNLANADGILPSERAALDLEAQDAQERVRRAEAEIADAMHAVAGVAHDRRDDVLAHADAIQAKARKKSASVLAKLAEAERERLDADSLATWLREIASSGEVVTFRQAHDATGAHIAAIEDALTGPQRQAGDYARVMAWMDANYDRVLPPLAAASMFPQLLLPSDVAQLLDTDTATVRAAYAEHRKRRNGGR